MTITIDSIDTPPAIAPMPELTSDPLASLSSWPPALLVLPSVSLVLEPAALPEAEVRTVADSKSLSEPASSSESAMLMVALMSVSPSSELLEVSANTDPPVTLLVGDDGRASTLLLVALEEVSAAPVDVALSSVPVDSVAAVDSENPEAVAAEFTLAVDNAGATCVATRIPEFEVVDPVDVDTGVSTGDVVVELVVAATTDARNNSGVGVVAVDRSLADPEELVAELVVAAATTGPNV